MPAEKFYFRGQVEGDSQGPDLTIAWGGPTKTHVSEPDPEESFNVLINGNPADRSGINRLIRVLRRARDQVHGADE